MSTKKTLLYDMAWRKMVEETPAAVDGITAGQFARLMGIARSTAVRWLTEMHNSKGVYCTDTQHGNIIIRRYYPTGGQL